MSDIMRFIGFQVVTLTGLSLIYWAGVMDGTQMFMTIPGGLMIGFVAGKAAAHD